MRNILKNPATLALIIGVGLCQTADAQNSTRTGKTIVAGACEQPIIEPNTPLYQQQLLNVIDAEIARLEQAINDFRPRLEIIWLSPPPPPEPEPVIIASVPIADPTPPEMPPVVVIPDPVPVPEPVVVIPDPVPEPEPVVVIPDPVWTGDDGGDGGGDCLCEYTLITLPNGDQLPIQFLTPGQMVMGQNRRSNTILEVIRTPIDERTIYELNQVLQITADHPILTPSGWKALDPDLAKRWNPSLTVGELKIGDVLYTDANSTTTLERIDEIEPLGDYLYNLFVDGDGTFYAEGILVHHMKVKKYDK